MSNGNKSFKICRACALALALPLGYFSLAATGLVGPAGASSIQAATEVNEDATKTVQKQVDAIVAGYLEVQDLLAQDKLEGVKAQHTRIRENAKSLAESGSAKVAAQAKTIAKHALVAEPKTLEQAREAFKPLSSAVIGLAQLAPPTSKVAPALYEATCPMAKANWLQKTKDLENPYMGKAMLKCGSIEQTIKEPAPGSKEAERSALNGAAPAGSCCMMQMGK